jgi:UPF0716 protein FxsA
VLLRLLLLFVAVPTIELLLLLALSELTGFWTTVLLILSTGIIGAWLARRQGVHTWQRIQQQLAAGQVPASDLIEGMLILIAGTLLITPGLLTDTVGFLLLVPRVRHWGRIQLTDWLKARTIIRFGHFGPGPTAGPDGDGVIDAEFTRRPSEEGRIEP